MKSKNRNKFYTFIRRTFLNLKKTIYACEVLEKYSFLDFKRTLDLLILKLSGKPFKYERITHFSKLFFDLNKKVYVQRKQKTT